MLQTFLQMFRRGICRIEDKVQLQFDLGACINPTTGFYEKGHPEWMCDFHFYPVSKGDRVVCANADYCFAIASYSSEIEHELMYTYCYQQEENWAKYRNDFCPECLIQEEYKIPEDGWIRIAVRRRDGASLTENDVTIVKESMELRCQKKEYKKKSYFEPEIKHTVQTVKNKKKEGNLVFGLMTDSHYVINGGWEDTVANLQAVNAKVKWDGMIHLGDITDGMVPLTLTKEYVDIIMWDLKGLGVPIYLTLGNYDSNYFKQNPEWMSEEEQSKFYLNRQKPWYYIDFEKQNLRCIFLHSFNHREHIRYGFSPEEIEWVREVLAKMPQNMKVLVFAHVPLLPKMHYWSKEIRNSSEMLQVLEEHVQQGGTILAYVHGHNHADQICYDKSFPIVSIGCAKCEDFKDKKPKGSVTYDRKMGTVSQELWDVMIVDTDENRLEYVRFGAGEDRTV